MNKSMKYIPLFSLILGLLGLGLRIVMYRFCVDGRGLLERGNFYHIACWILTLLTAGALTLAVGRLNGTTGYQANFPASRPAGLGCWLGSAGIALTILLPGQVGWDILGILWRIAGILSAACLIWVGICRLSGRLPHFLLYAAVCIFFALHLICYYQVWSGEPQTPDYSFQLLACVLLTLFAYSQTAFAADLGSRRSQLLSGLLSGYLCCLALARTATPWLFAGCGLWALTNLCTIVPPKRRRYTGSTEEVA